MPTPLPEIQGVDDSANWIRAAQMGRNNALQDQSRALNQNIGNALAGGDMDEAANVAARGGNLDAFGTIQKWSKQASDDELEKVKRTHEIATNLLTSIKTPQQLEMALGVATSSGALPPEEASKIRQQVQRFGLEPTLQYHAATIGRQNEPIQAAQAQRAQERKDLGQTLAATPKGDDEAAAAALVNLAKQGNSQAAQYLTPEGALLPGARASILGLGGLGGDVLRYNSKSEGGGGKTLALNAGTQRVLDQFVAKNPEWKGREAEIGGLAQKAYQNKSDIVLGEDGQPKLSADAGTMLSFRANQQNPDLQRELSEYKTIGKEDGALAQRKSIAGGALNHLETVSQISDQDLENAIGVIHGSGGYQKFADLVNSGRVENSAAYRNAKQTLAVLLKETQNAYHIAGTGAESDARLKETADALSPESLLESPNIEVFRQRLANIRAILQGVINSPRPSAFGSRSQNTAGSAASEEEVRRVSGAPEKGGQVRRLEPGKEYNWNPAKGGLE